MKKSHNALGGGNLASKKRLLAAVLATSMAFNFAPANVLYAADPAQAAAGTARSKTLAAPKDSAAVTASAPTDWSALPTGKVSDTVEWKGNYIVTADTAIAGTVTSTLTNYNIPSVTVSDNTQVWIEEGKTLTITGPAGYNATTDLTTFDGKKPAAAIKISSGKTLTFSGPGTLVVEGGVGGKGFVWDQVNTGLWQGQSASNYSGRGGWGSEGGNAFDNAGTLTFAPEMLGQVTITGGTGGAGGKGRHGATAIDIWNGGSKYFASDFTHDPYGTPLAQTGGTGGDGGIGGLAVNNAGGTVNFNHDSSGKNLIDGTYTIGNVNVMGGKGGIAGDGGDAAYASVARYSEPGHIGSYPYTYGATVTSDLSYYTVSNVDSGVHAYAYFYQYKPTLSGSAGTSGTGGAAFRSGTVNLNSGVTGIEGGFGTSGASAGTPLGATLTLSNRHWHTQTQYTYQRYQTGTNAQGGPIYSGYSLAYTTRLADTYDLHTVTVNPIYTGIGSPNSYGGVAFDGVTVNNNGGTSYAFGGYSNRPAVSSHNGGTVGGASSTDSTGSIYASYSFDTGHSANLAASTKVTLQNLEGFGDFESSYNNFYVLNKGDTWQDANGDTHTSKGILADGVELTAKDVYVNPQGMLYLANIPATAAIELDVAVNTTRNGVAGEVKEVYLSKPGAGVYRFTGTANGSTAVLTARYATDAEADGSDQSYDSSFDVYWLYQTFKTAPTDPVSISTAPQLAAVAWAVNNGVPGAAAAKYKLANDIDLGSFSWTPIGTKSNPFTGNFDGNGKTVYNMQVNAIDGVDAYGLFGYTDTATIDNLTLTRQSFTHAYAKTAKSHKGNTPHTNASGGKYTDVTRYVVDISRETGDVFAGAVAGHATDTSMSDLKAIGMDVSAATNDASATVAAGGLVGYTVSDDTSDAFKNFTVTGGGTLSGLGIDNSGKVYIYGGAEAYSGGVVGYIENVDVIGAAITNVAPGTSSSATSKDVWIGGAIGFASNSSIGTVTINQTAANADGYPYGVLGATGTGKIYAGGIVGRLKTGKLLNSAITGVTLYAAVSTGTGDTYTGGAVGHSSDASVSGVTVNNATAYTSMSITGDSYAGGIAGRADNTGISGSEIKRVQTITATSEANGAGYAGGISGYITGDTGKNLSSLISNNKVNAANANAVSITANANGAGIEAAAGGLIGYGEEISAFGNVYLNPSNTAANKVTAVSELSSAYAGGLIGNVLNEGDDNVAVNDMTIKNVAVAATGGDEGYAGGVVGKSDAEKGLEMVNVKVLGDTNASVTSIATNDAYAGRLAGDANIANIVSCTFDNHINNKTVNVSALSADKDIYIGGLAGNISESGNIGASGVSMVNVNASATGTAYAGGLVGKAADTSIMSSSVNYYTNSAGTDVFSKTSSLTVSDAAETYAGGIAGHIANSNTLVSADESIYKINNALSVTMTLPSSGVTAGGLYGKINNALIGMSYARNYTIKTASGGVPSGKVAGIAGGLDASELVAVYGVGSTVNGDNNRVISAFPGMYHTGGGNKFHGSYALHTKFAETTTTPDAEYRNSYFVDSSGSGTINKIPDTVVTAEAAEPYYVKNAATGLYELKETYNDGKGANTYRYDKPTAVKRDEFHVLKSGSVVNNSMWQILHRFRIPDGQITTRYEQRMGVSLLYALKSGDIESNYGYPFVIPPKEFTLMVMPGTNYGHIKENEGQKTYSTYTTPGTKVFTPTSMLIFTAEEQATLPKDDYFYAFNNWVFTKTPAAAKIYAGDANTGKATTTELISPYSASNVIRLVMPEAAVSLTANFEQRDNRIRAAINTAISGAMTEVYQDAAFKSVMDDLLVSSTDADTEKAIQMLYDAILLDDAKYPAILNTFSDQILDLNGGAGAPYFLTVYPGASIQTYKNLADKDAVAKQIIKDALRTVMERDTFEAGTYVHDVVTFDNKIDFVDIGVTLFSGSGSFNDYVYSQYAFEQSGTTTGITDNTRPGVKEVTAGSEPGTFSLELTNLFKGNGVPNTGNAATVTAGSKALYFSYVDPYAAASVSAIGLISDDALATTLGLNNGGSIWSEIPNQGGALTCDVKLDTLSALNDGGKSYIYLREVDENGYEVITRVQVGTTDVMAENRAILDGEGGAPKTANTGIGNGQTDEDGQHPLNSADKILWFGAVELYHADKADTLNGDADNDGYYFNGKGGDVSGFLYLTSEIPGAYAESMYLVVSASALESGVELPDAWGMGDTGPYEYYEIPLVPGSKNVLITGGAIAYTEATGKITISDIFKDGVKFEGTVTQPSFADTNGNGTINAKPGQIAYKPINGVTVKTKYVNVLGELNASAEAADDAAQLEQLAAILKYKDTSASPNVDYAMAMDLAEGVMAVYNNLPDDYTDPGNESDPSYIKDGALLTQDNLHGLLLGLMPVNGYPTATDANNVLTYVAALQELLDIVNDNDASINSKLSSADIKRIKDAADRTRTLLDGKDYSKDGTPALDPAELAYNLNLLYNSGSTLYNILSGVQLDTVTLTVKSNIMKYVLLDNEGGSANASMTSGTLFAKKRVNAPKPIQATLSTNMLISGLSAAAQAEPVFDSKAIVVRKGDTANITISKQIDADGYAFKAYFEDEPLNITTTGSVGVKNGFGDYALTASNMLSGRTLIVEFGKMELTLDKDAGCTFTNFKLTTPGGLKTDPIAEVTFPMTFLHGDDLPFVIVPDSGFILPIGSELVYEEGGVKKSVPVKPDGSFTIPNVTGEIEILGLDTNGDGNITADDKLLDLSSGFEDYLESVADKYFDDPETQFEFTPDTWKEVRDAYDDAKTAGDKQGAYDALAEALGKLVPQHRITIPVTDPEYYVPKAGDPQFPSSTAIEGSYTAPQDADYAYEVEVLQNGVIKVTKDFDDSTPDEVSYYVQDGYGCMLAPTADGKEYLSNKDITQILYNMGGDNYQAPFNNEDAFIIPSVTGEISGITVNTDDSSFSVTPGKFTGPGGVGKVPGTTTPIGTGKTDAASIPGYSIPDISVSAASVPVSVTVTITDDSGSNHTIYAYLGDNDGDGEADDVEYLYVDGVSFAGGIPDGLLDDVVSGGNIVIPSEKLHAVIDAYNSATYMDGGTEQEYSPKIIVGPDTTATAKVDYEDGTSATPFENEPSDETDIDVRTYVITPAGDYHVAVVVVDGETENSLALPGDETVKSTIERARAKKPYTSVKSGDSGTMYYTEISPVTGSKVTVEVDGTGNIVSVTVDPGVNSDYSAVFNTDLNDPDYGSALVVWKDGNNQHHMADAVFDSNMFPVSLSPDKLTGGNTVIVDADDDPDTGHNDTITAGSDATITITTGAGFVLDPLARITVSVPSVQGFPAVYISDSLNNLMTNPEVSVKVDPVTGAVSITVPDIHGPLTVVTGPLFKNSDKAAADADAKELLLDALKELQTSVNLGESIKATSPGDPYTQTGFDWSDFLSDCAAGAGILGDLTKPNSDELKNAITLSDADRLVDVINELMGKTGSDKFADATEILNYINDAKDALDDAILNLNTAGTDVVAVLPGMTDEKIGLGGDEGINHNLPLTAVKDGSAGVNGGDMEIGPVYTLPGYEADNVVITVTDPGTGKEYQVSIPVTDGEALPDDGRLTVTVLDPVTGKPDSEFTISLPITDTGADSSNAPNITVPGKTITDIVNALTGSDKPCGVITEAELDINPSDVFTAPGKAGVDPGIDTGADTPDVTASGSGIADKIELPAEGIVVGGISLNDGYELEGIDITVTYTDKNDDPAVLTIFVPATELNTSGAGMLAAQKPFDSANDPYTVTVTPGALEKLIKDALKDDLKNPDSLTGVNIVDIDVVTGAKLIGPGVIDMPAGLDGGIITTAPGNGTVAVVLADDDINDGVDTDTLFVDGIEAKPGFELDGITVQITDPSTGTVYEVTIPVTDGGNLSGTLPVSIIDPVDGTAADGGFISVTGDLASDEGAGYDDAADSLSVPLKTIEDIIKALETEKGLTKDLGYVSDVSVDSERIGHVLPESGVATPGIATDNDGTDPIVISTSGGDDVLSGTGGAGEDLIISNIKPEDGYKVDNVEITITNPVTGEDIVIKVPAELPDSDSYYTFSGSYADENGKTHAFNVSVPADSIDVDDVICEKQPDDTFTVTIGGDALETVLKKAIETVVAGEFGTKALELDSVKDAIENGGFANTDISDITVNCTGDGERVIDVPGTAEAGKGIDKSKPSPSVVVQDAGGNAQIGLLHKDDQNPSGLSDTPGGIVIDNIATLPGHKPETITFDIRDDAGNVITVIIPVDGEWTGSTEIPYEIHDADGSLDTSGTVTVLELGSPGEPQPDSGTLPGTDKIVIPGEILNGLIAEIFEANGLDLPASIIEIQVDAGRDSMAIPGSPFGDSGLITPGDIYVEKYDTVAVSVPDSGGGTDSLDDMDVSKGIVITGITAGEANGTVDEIVITLEDKDGSGTVTITVKLDTNGDVTDVSVEAGSSIDLPSAIEDAIKAGLSSEDAAAGGDPYKLALSGNVLDAIADLAGFDKAAVLDSVEVGTTGSGAGSGEGECTVTGLKPKGKDTGTDDMTLADNLVIDNILLKDGYVLDGVSLTVDTDGPDGNENPFLITVCLPMEIDETTSGAYVIVQAYSPEGVPVTGAGPDGTDSDKIAVWLTSEEAIAIGEATVEQGGKKITLPGSALDEIIRVITGTDEAADISKVEVLTNPNGWILPPATEVATSNSDGLAGIVIAEDSPQGKSSSATIDGSGAVSGDGKGFVVKKDGTLALELSYALDDFPAGNPISYHTFDGLYVDGVLLSAAGLLSEGVITRGSDGLDSIYADSESITIDLAALADYYKDASGGRELTTLSDLAIFTKPQNSQYESFVIDFTELSELVAAEGTEPSDPDERRKFEELVEKLLDQFSTSDNAATQLSPDNKDHLLDKWGQLDEWKLLIDSKLKAELAEQDINNLFDSFNEALKNALDAAGEISADPDFNYVEYLAENLGSILEENPSIMQLLTDFEDEIQGARDSYGSLNDYSKDLIDFGTKDKLESMSDLLDDAKMAAYGEEAYIRMLLDELAGGPPQIAWKDTPNTDDSIKGDSELGGAELSDRIDELDAFGQKLQRIEDLFGKLSPETRANMGDVQYQLDILGNQADGEFNDLTAIYAKEFLTADGAEYDGAGSPSAESGNGLKKNGKGIKVAVTEALVAYNKLPDSVQKSIDGLFFEPTVKELYNDVFNIITGGLLDADGILDALAKVTVPAVDYISGTDLGGEPSSAVIPSNKSVLEWANKVASLEDSYNALDAGDKSKVDDALKTENSDLNGYPELLAEANKVIAESFITGNSLDDLEIPLTNPITDPGDIRDIRNAEEAWGKLSQGQKDAVNEALEAKYQSTFEELLEATVVQPASDQHKTDAIAELEQYYNDLLDPDKSGKTYTTEQKAQLKDALDAAILAVERAQTDGGVDKAVTSGKKEMDSIGTATDGYVLSGKVYLADGSPADKATVKVALKTADGVKTYTATTKNGEYSINVKNLESGFYAIYVDGFLLAEGSAYKQQPITNTSLTQELEPITLDTGLESIVGGIITESGKPIVNGKVTVIDKNTGKPVDIGENPFETLSKSTTAGGYVAAGLEDGVYIIQYQSGSTSGQTEIVVENGAVTPNRDGFVTNTNIGSSKGGIVSGTALGANGGTATVTISVPVFGEDGSVIGAKTLKAKAEGDEGYYQFAGIPAGTYLVTITDDATGESVVEKITVPGGQLPYAIVAPADMTAADGTPKAITGIVMDKDGKPLAGSTVTLFNSKAEVIATGVAVDVNGTSTGTGGGYSILLPDGLPDGSYYISANDGAMHNGLTGPVNVKNGAVTSGKTNIIVTNNDTQSAVISGSLLTGTVSYTVTDSPLTTAAAAGATVVVKDADGKTIATTTTNNDGVYFVGGVPGGATVSVITSNNQTGLINGCDVINAGNIGEIYLAGDITAAQPGSGVLLVVGPHGEMLPMGGDSANLSADAALVTVKAEDGTDVTGNVGLNASGIISINQLPAGSYTITIEQNGMKVVTPVTLVTDPLSGESFISGGNIFKIGTTNVAGTLKYDTPTASYPGSGTFKVFSSGGSFEWASGKVDPTSGKFTVRDIPDGDYRIELELYDSENPALTATLKATLTVKDGVKTYGAFTDSTTGTTAAASPSATSGNTAITIQPSTAVNTVIGKLTTAAQSGVLTAMQDAKTEYDKLSLEQKKQISSTLVTDLADAITRTLDLSFKPDALGNALRDTASIKSSLGSMASLLLSDADINSALDARISTLAGASSMSKEITVDLVFNAEDVTDDPKSDDKSKAEAVANSKSADVAAYFDLTVEKTVTVSEIDGSNNSSPLSQSSSMVPKLAMPIKITLGIPSAYQRLYEYYAIVRIHDNKPELLPSSFTDTSITFYSDSFSTYALLYSNDPIFEFSEKDTPTVDPGGPPISNPGGDQLTTGSGLSAGSASSETVTVNKPAGGTVSVSDSKAKEGQKVTITVVPDPGFELDILTVTNASGAAISFVDNGDGTYTYIQPEGVVSVEALFRQALAVEPGAGPETGVSRFLNTDDHFAYVIGDDRGMFNPDASITRAEVAQIFYNLLIDKAYGNNAPAFADVAEDTWYARAVNTLASLGFIKGYDNVNFGPGDSIRRGDFVRLVSGFAYPAEASHSFTDIADSYYALDSINTAVSYGWINGYEDGTFRADRHITRAEAVKVINAMLQRSPDKLFIDRSSGTRVFPDLAKEHWAYYQVTEAATAHDHEITDMVESWIGVRK